MVDAALVHPSTELSRLHERQSRSREQLNSLLDSTVLATVAFVRDGHPVALPIGAARLGDELVIHGSTGSPWLNHLAAGVPVSVCVSVGFGRVGSAGRVGSVGSVGLGRRVGLDRVLAPGPKLGF